MTAPSPFHEVQFPSSISLGASGGPGWLTTVLTLASGFERRNINWSKSRAKYDVSHGLKTQSQIDELIAFFNARRGKAYGFRFRDWTDYLVPNDGIDPPVLFTTDATTSTVQIAKVYQDNGNSYIRTITKPVSGTVVVYDNSLISSDWTVDTTTGIITLGSTLRATTGHTVAVSCEFDVPVRFDIDDLNISITDIDNFALPQIPLVEVRV